MNTLNCTAIYFSYYFFSAEKVIVISAAQTEL